MVSLQCYTAAAAVVLPHVRQLAFSVPALRTLSPLNAVSGLPPLRTSVSCSDSISISRRSRLQATLQLQATHRYNVKINYLTSQNSMLPLESCGPGYRSR